MTTGRINQVSIVLPAGAGVPALRTAPESVDSMPKLAFSQDGKDTALEPRQAPKQRP